MDEKIISEQENHQTNNNLLMSTSGIVAGCSFLVNNIYYMFMGYGNLNFWHKYTYVDIFASFIKDINPLNIPVMIIGNFFNYGGYWSYIWHNPYYAIIELIEYGDFSFTYFIVPIILYISGPCLCYIIGKKISESKPSDILNSSSKTVLNYKDIINNSREIGFKNVGTILGTMILWTLTGWIPYLNVGTTIGLFGMIIALGKGEQFSPTKIFDAKYRRNMGEFFLLLSFLSIGISIGSLFVIIPGIVIGIAWSQCILLLIDRNLSPLEAIKISNDITYGEKVTMFIGYILLILFYGLIIGIAFIIPFALESYLLVMIFAIIGYCTFMLILLGFASYIYAELSKKL